MKDMQELKKIMGELKNSSSFDSPSIHHNVPQEYTKGMQYEYDGLRQTAKLIDAGDAKDAIRIIIPSTIAYNGQVYNVTAIGEWAFKECDQVVAIDIPSSVHDIEWFAFEKCSKLSVINIPESIDSIGMYAFSECKSLTSIKLPSSIAEIQSSTFQDCESLASIVIPNGVSKIGDSAFWGCSSLYSLVIPSSVTHIGESAFRDCKSLSSIVIPNSVTYVGESAFYNCQNLEKVKISDNVIRIEKDTFYNCDHLEFLTIGEKVENIDLSAFSGCVRLKDISAAISGLSKYYSREGVLFHLDELIFYPRGREGKYVVPNHITAIGDFAFYICNGLTSITIPENVISIGKSAFSFCDNLREVVVNSKYIGEKAFVKCDNLTSVIMGDEVRVVGPNAFSWCKKLELLDLGNGVTEIGEFAFNYCWDLCNVKLPESVRVIGVFAFRDTGLQSIKIPIGVDKMEEHHVFPDNCRITQRSSDNFKGKCQDSNKSLIELTINLHQDDGDKHLRLNLILVKGDDVLPDYFISDTPITQGTWNMIMDSKKEIEKCSCGRGDQYPMYYLNVQDCKDFISKLNDQLLRELKKASNTKYTFDKFDLPTELQWEYAANEGQKVCKFEYSGSDDIDEVAWYRGNSDSHVHEVKTKEPNALMLYDMSGNVMEWCKKGNTDQYVTRGGSWYHNADECRVNSRSTIYSEQTEAAVIGFRIVLLLKEIK